MSSATGPNLRRTLAPLFDPQRSRDELQNWTLEVFRKLSFEDAYHQRQLGYCGIAASEVAVETMLVGLFKDSKDLISRAHAFLMLSIGRKEQSEHSKASILERAALMAWLQYRKDDRKSPRAAVEWNENAFHTEESHRESEVQRGLPIYLEAQEYQKLITRFESTGSKAPASLGRIRGQGTMAYVIAKQRLGIDFDQPSVAQSLDAFLVSLDSRMARTRPLHHRCTLDEDRSLAVRRRSGRDAVCAATTTCPVSIRPTILRCYAGGLRCRPNRAAR